MLTFKNESLLSVSECIMELIQHDELEPALRAIHDFVERIITEPLCTSQVYGSKVLDDLCQKIGKRNLTKLGARPEGQINKASNSEYVYIVTKLQKSGGHTRVIEDFIMARPDARHYVLSTELAGRSNIGFLMKGLAKNDNIRFEAAPHKGLIWRLTWLQQRLVEIGADRTYLFNHHQDSVAVAAIQPEMGLDASFYHHGDHHLCLGLHLPHLEHIDPHPMGYHYCRDTLGINNTYIPLTAGDKGDRPGTLGFMSDGTLTTCTAARSNKIEIPYFVSYLDVIPKLLKTTGGRHVHIGRLTPWALFKINRSLKRYGVGQDRFTYIPWVPSVWQALHKNRVDLYVASFPYGGGLTLIEAMGAGVPVALHRHIYSRVLSGIELAYTSAFSWRYPDELLDYCSKLTPTNLQDGGRLARLQYEKYHRQEILEELIVSQDRVALKPAELRSDFSPESDEWAAWVERQVSCRRAIWRGAYRLFRGIRGKYFWGGQSGALGTLGYAIDSDYKVVMQFGINGESQRSSDYFKHLRNRNLSGLLYRKLFLYPRLVRQLTGRVLDVGCGIGDFLAHRPNTVGVDVNAYAVDWCQSRGLDARLMEADHLPFEDACFDGVALDNVLEHLSEPMRLLAEIRRVLTPGGRVLVGVPGTFGYTCDADHKIFYDESNLRQVMESAGLMQNTVFYMPIKWDWLDAKLPQYCLYGVFERS